MNIGRMIIILICNMCADALAKLGYNLSSLAQQAFNRTISPDCLDRCGNVIIAYPFGKGSNCASSSSTIINCDNTSIPNEPFLTVFNLEVFEITRSSVQVNLPSDSNLPTMSRDSFVAALILTNVNAPTVERDTNVRMRWGGGVRAARGRTKLG
ncbi:hypothetical protein LguiB_005980 [Lonicera macranthoides]